MLLKLIIILQVALFCGTGAWYNGPDGKEATEGTPEFVANHYLRKIFEKYSADVRVTDEIGVDILRKVMNELGLGLIHEIPKEAAGVVDGHDVTEEEHRKKRSTSRFADAAWSTPHDHKNVTGNKTDCVSAPLLIEQYKLDQRVAAFSGIRPYEFGLLCPALVFLSGEKSCIVYEKEEEKPDIGSVWGYGFLSITIISLLSFFGVLIVPCLSKNFFHSILSLLVAGAIGALCGDALLHLIPHSQSPSHGHSKEPINKNLMVLFGIYVLFVVEGIMKLVQKTKRRKKWKEELKRSRTESDEKMVQTYPVGIRRDSVSHDDNRAEMEVHSNRKGSTHGPNHNHGDIAGKGIASMAWMVIAGDGMHNFSDGVAIGAAFSSSLIGGLSTSVAVFCHELPHELGDFAMLVKSGMSVKQALLYNGFAACLGYIGLAVGILIGNYAAYVTPWIFACTAGMFLYVALVDMLPEMDVVKENQSTATSLYYFFLQNIGIVIGVVIMYLISVYEESFEFSD